MLVREATAEADLALAKALVLEYAQGLGLDLSFQSFDQEMDAFPGGYSPPTGLVLLARFAGEPAGCACLRAIDGDGVCEVKRLYVRPAFRGRSIGRGLAEAAIEAARDLGYTAMRLDTLGSMAEAISLYRSLGFRPIDPYYSNPIPNAAYFELALR